MNYKHILAAAALALATCGSMGATDASQLRIYINPGHGSWTSNDRAMQTIGRAAFNSSNLDTTGFFESNTNLIKGLGLLEKLREYGLTYDPTLNQTTSDISAIGAAKTSANNIMMSRVKNSTPPPGYEGDAFNRTRTVIAAEAESWNCDMFISIHSNAATEGSTTNYPLFEFRGTDNNPYVATSDVMAETVWPYLFNIAHMMWGSTYSLTHMNIRGDISFGGSTVYGNGLPGYLGVLMSNVPGFLVEGYFHTYQPGRQRAMNWDVDRQEGVAYARGIADYFGLTGETTGDIYGIVRDKHEKFTDDLYHPMSGTPDIYKPLNGVTVTLKKDDAVVDTYTTDQEWNGAFVFTHLEPGVYTMEFSAEGYRECDPVSVTVTEASTVYPLAYLESEEYDPNEVNYPDLIDNPAINAASKYDMQQEYVDNEISELAGKTIRRTVLRDDYLYVLAIDENNDPTIIVYDTENKEVVANVSTTGIAGDFLKVSDIQLTADGVLVACPETEVDYSSMYGDGKMTFYKWEKGSNGLPTGDPEELLSASGRNAACYFHTAYGGDTFTYSGRITEGKIIYSARDMDTDEIRACVVTIEEGEDPSLVYTKPTYGDDPIYLSTAGEDYKFVVSPLDDDNYVIAGSGSMPVSEYSVLASKTIDPVASVPESVIPAATPNVGFFKYAGHAYMAAPAIEDSQSTGVKLIDVTDGFGSASVITTTNTTIDAADLTNISAKGTTMVITNIYEEVTDAYINLFLTRGDGTISKFTTLGVEQPLERAEYAYDLAGEEGDGTYTVTFKSTGDAPDANLILEDEEGNTVTISIGAVTEGENSLTVNTDEVAEGTYNWKIEIISDPITNVNKIYSALSYTHGLAIDRNPESDYFGYAYASDPYSSSRGLFMFTPDLQQVNEAPYCSSESWGSSVNSPYRLAVNPNSGKVLVSDWSDAHSGLWMFDPANTGNSLVQLFGGTLQGSGAYVYDGVTIGGGGPSASFYGSGSDTKLYQFSEDYPTGNAGNVLVGYDLGEAETITAIPSLVVSGSTSILTSTDVNVIANDKGIWCSQNSEGNASSKPAFVQYDFDGNLLFNSSSVTALDGSHRGGMAFSDDLSQLAIVNYSDEIVIFDIEWEGTTPYFTKSYAFTFNTSSDSNANECYQLQFDQAGNLFVANHYGLQVYGLPNDNPVAVTPAKAEYLIVGTSGIKEILADDASAQLKVYPNPATGTVNIEAGAEIGSISLYNLAGATMKADALINGSSATLDVEGLASGIYLLNVDGKTAKLIKK